MKNGAAFLRDCVSFLDARDEHLNDNKDYNQLIKDFINGPDPIDPNWYDN